MEILFYQGLIFTTLVLVRIFSARHLEIACLIWTALTLINLFWPPLIIVQLFVIWGTYGLIRPKKPQSLVLETALPANQLPKQKPKQLPQSRNSPDISSSAAAPPEDKPKISAQSSSSVPPPEAGRPTAARDEKGDAISISPTSQAKRPKPLGQEPRPVKATSASGDPHKKFTVEIKPKRVVLNKSHTATDGSFPSSSTVKNNLCNSVLDNPVTNLDVDTDCLPKALPRTDMLDAASFEAELERRKVSLEASWQREAPAQNQCAAKALDKPAERQLTSVQSEVSTEDDAEKFDELHCDEIRAYVKQIGIPHLIHFTRCENLRSIFRHGLHSIQSSDEEGIHSLRNDKIRLDGQPDGISLSVTFPNFRMFYKYRQMDVTSDWAVLLLSPKILWEKKCGFFRHNAADSRMRHLPRAEVTTVQALREMFESPGLEREQWLRPYDPTDPQAEVMVYETIEPDLIETVAFETKQVANKWRRTVEGRDTIYAGEGKGLFASRIQIRMN